MHKESLISLGLSSHEAESYLALLKSGPVSVLKLAKESGVNRSMLYGILGGLAEKGLVHQTVRGKKTNYVAEPPEKIEKLLQHKLELFAKLLPGLKSIAEHDTTKPVMHYFEGIEGIKNVYRGAITSKEKRLYAFVGVESLQVQSTELETFWDNEFKTERQKRGVYGQLLIPANKAGREFQAKDNKNFRESRFVDPEKYNFPAEILVYDDVVGMISYTPFEEFAMSLKSPALAATIKMLWRFMWEASEKIV